MGIRSTTIGWVTVLLCALSIQAGAAERLFFVPRGLAPSLFPAGRTQVTAPAGGRVCLEIYLTSEPPNVVAAQPAVPGAGIGGDVGSLAIDCASVAIDTSHPNFPPGGPEDIVSATRTVECPDEFAVFVVSNMLPGPLPIPAGGAYLGEVCYDLSSNASGTFAVDFITSPGPYSTMMLNTSFGNITDFTADGADITVGSIMACCLSDGSCQQIGPAQCVAAGGTVPGPALCGIVSCLGACCDDSGCSELSRGECEANQATFFGEGTLCTEVNCGCQTDADCDDGDACTNDVCRDGVCVNCDRHVADVNRDCTISLSDVFCVLKGFGGDFSCDQPCP